MGRLPVYSKFLIGHINRTLRAYNLYLKIPTIRKAEESRLKINANVVHTSVCIIAEFRITCLPEYFACYGSRNENRDWIGGRLFRGRHFSVPQCMRYRRRFYMRLDAKECEGPPGERNVLKMQYIRALFNIHVEQMLSSNNKVTKTCSDLSVVKEIIPLESICK